MTPRVRHHSFALSLAVLASLVLGFTLPAPAQAVAAKTFYVGPGGSDAFGVKARTFATRWATIGHANTMAMTDSMASINFGGVDSTVVFLIGGSYLGQTIDSSYTYTEYPDPGGATTVTPTGGKYWIYQYAGKVTNPRNNLAAAKLPDAGSAVLKYTSIRGFYIKGAASFNVGSHHDSLTSCAVDTSFYLNAGDDIVVTACKFMGPEINISGSTGADSICNRITIQDCLATNLQLNREPRPMCIMGADTLKFLRNHFVFVQNEGDEMPVYVGNMKGASWKNNKWEFTSNRSDASHFIYLRDATEYLTVVSDTFLVTGTRGMGHIGVFPGTYSGTVTHITLDSLYFRVGAGACLNFGDPVKQWTITNSVFVGGTFACTLGGLNWYGPNLIDHNTFAAHTDSSDTGERGIVGWGDWTFATDTTKFTNNIVYNTVGESRDALGSEAQWYWPTVAKPLLMSEWNLYWTKAYSYIGGVAVAGARSIWYQDDVSPYTHSTRPGIGHGESYYGFSASKGKDILSTWGSPAVVDSSLLSFDPALTSGSAAIGRGKDSRDIGARSYAGATNTYYVRPPPYGSDGNSGASFALAWATIAYANLLVNTNGYRNAIIYVYGSGTTGEGSASYDAFPNPASDATGGATYRFIGRTGAHGSADIRLPAATLIKPWVRVRGFYIADTLRLTETADHDSIADCTIQGSVFFKGADYTTLDNCTIEGPRLGVQVGAVSAWRFSDGCNITRNTMLNSRPWADDGVPTSSTVDRQGWLFQRYTDSLTVKRNHVHFTMNGNQNCTTPIKLAQATSVWFEDNRWEIDNQATRGNEFGFALTMQDSTSTISFNRDTILAIGGASQGNYLALSYDGTYPVTVSTVTIDSCYWSFELGGVWAQSGIAGLSLTRSALVSTDRNAFKCWGFRGRNVINHNTFSSLGAGVGDAGVYGSGTVSLGQSFGTTDTTIFTNNIVYNAVAGGTIGYATICSPGQPNMTCALYVQPSTRYVSDWNQYFLAPYSGTHGDHSILYTTGKTVATTGSSLPGSGGAFNTKYAACDAHSIYGGPEFDIGGPDSVFVSSLSRSAELFNPRTGPYTVGKTAGVDGTTIGAFESATSVAIQLSKTYCTLWANYDSESSDEIMITSIGTDSLLISNPVVSDANLTATFDAVRIAAGKATTLTLTASTLPVPEPIHGPITTPPDDRHYTLTFTTNDPLNPTVVIDVYYRWMP